MICMTAILPWPGESKASPQSAMTKGIEGFASRNVIPGSSPKKWTRNCGEGSYS